MIAINRIDSVSKHTIVSKVRELPSIPIYRDSVPSQSHNSRSQPPSNRLSENRLQPPHLPPRERSPFSIFPV
ncbi:hypothetical protein HanXRQr2_Chr12g0565181 [Helianthus annuus]|uniref:Uncharacterized protein n=1 Tax=Helianthus annuus TaxID=4232 RepID=A0A251T5F6_HELAN|nr:hypothetical protein HanXRQr2_Chr12g0565181 [Helianthus annuus]KAJ0864657.1 hypothetical protein HanPSC8_Chr12g0544481 [Helianthus annuus]